ncbi:MAG: hypothetical protein HOY76_01680 [Streptomyces sp.]|nr:hypothetical protein [Streptomyces sp.]
MQHNHPTTTVRIVPAAPIPLWERQHLFVEPVYVDGKPYDEPAQDAEGKARTGDTSSDAAA